MGKAFCNAGCLANLADTDFWELRGIFAEASRSLTPFAMRRCRRLLQLTAAISEAETNWSSLAI